jgi:hypothetical protein
MKIVCKSLPSCWVPSHRDLDSACQCKLRNSQVSVVLSVAKIQRVNEMACRKLSHISVSHLPLHVLVCNTPCVGRMSVHIQAGMVSTLRLLRATSPVHASKPDIVSRSSQQTMPTLQLICPQVALAQAPVLRRCLAWQRRADQLPAEDRESVRVRASPCRPEMLPA